MKLETTKHASTAAAGRETCRACGGGLSLTMADLGLQPASNAYLAATVAIAAEKRYPLRAKVCAACRLVQLDYDVPPQELFADYAYFSSYSDTWMAHARRYCEMACTRFALGAESLVVELASNDGYLLKNFAAAGVPVLGIEPADTVAAAAVKIGVPTLVEFFGLAVARRLAAEGRQADLVVANNVLAHVPALNDFVAGIAALLKRDGVATLEFPHLLTLLEHVEFDTIYHEHFSYFSLLAIERLFARHGLVLFDVEELPTHGGSLRIFACRKGEAPRAESAGLDKIRADEARVGLDRDEPYRDFAARVEACRRSVRSFLDSAKAAGKSVAAYGAAAKGNTLLNFCGVTSGEISMVADRNPHKQGKLLPGTHIPIVAPEALMAAQPDYIIVLPWNLKDEIMQQLAACRAWGGRFATPVPTLEIAP